MAKFWTWIAHVKLHARMIRNVWLICAQFQFEGKWNHHVSRTHAFRLLHINTVGCRVKTWLRPSSLWEMKREERGSLRSSKNQAPALFNHDLPTIHISYRFNIHITDPFFHNMSRIWGIPIFFRYRPWSRLPWKKLPFVSKREAPWTWMQIMMGKFHPMNSWRTFSEFTFVPMSCWSGCLWKMDCWDLCNRPLAFLKVTGFQEGVRHETWYHVKVLLWY